MLNVRISCRLYSYLIRKEATEPRACQSEVVTSKI
jgi:hypothetical protein